MESNCLQVSAYTYLYDEICSGRLAPGAPIVEQSISDKLNISRTPVREAIKRLESENLVEHFPYRGTFVSTLSIQDIQEIYQIRKIFELASVDSAVQDASDAELLKLQSTLLAVNEHSPLEEFYSSDRALHAMLLRYNYNSRMISFYNVISAQVERIRHISSESPRRMLLSRDEHLEIIAALLARDAERTKAALSVHMEQVTSAAISVYKQMRVGMGRND